MRKVLLVLLITSFYVSCKKDEIAIQDNSSKTIIETAKKYFNDNVATANASSSDNPRIQTVKTPQWEKAYTAQLPIGNSVVVPVHYSRSFYIKTNFSGNDSLSLDSITYLLVYKDAEHSFHAVLITAFPDSIYVFGKSHDFKGLIFVDDWSGKAISKFKYNAQGMFIYDPSKPNNQSSSEGVSVLSETVETCTQIVGYNYSADDPDNGVSWAEDPVCNTYFLPVHVGSPVSSFGISIGILPPGGGGSGLISPAAKAGVLPGSNPIANIRTYMGCFTNISGNSNTYTITVCVDQPTPGDRTPWDLLGSPSQSSTAGNIIDPGHVFLIFTQTSGSYIIRRNVGFYPIESVNPKSPQSPGMLNDDEYHNYDISLTVTVTNSQFYQIMNAVEAGAGPLFTYDLNTNNCTSFMLTALQAGGIDLPSTIGTWLGGSGNDPGDLGEDIRYMTLSSGETRSTTDAFHQNTGSCQ